MAVCMNPTPRGFIRLTENGVQYLGTGAVAWMGKTWSKITGGVMYDMSNSEHRQKIIHLWRSMKSELDRPGEGRRSDEYQRRVDLLEQALQTAGITPESSI